MRTLFVTMSDSIHPARWIKQISDYGWDIHLFPCVAHGIVHPQMNNITIHHLFYTKTQKRKDRNQWNEIILSKNNNIG